MAMMRLDSAVGVTDCVTGFAPAHVWIPGCQPADKEKEIRIDQRLIHEVRAWETGHRGFCHSIMRVALLRDGEVGGWTQDITTFDCDISQAQEVGVIPDVPFY